MNVLKKTSEGLEKVIRSDLRAFAEYVSSIEEFNADFVDYLYSTIDIICSLKLRLGLDPSLSDIKKLLDNLGISGEFSEAIVVLEDYKIVEKTRTEKIILIEPIIAYNSGIMPIASAYPLYLKILRLPWKIAIK